MRLDAEGRPAIDTPSTAQVTKVIERLRSYGPCSFASLTDDVGNFVQVGGGGVTCVVERKDAKTGLIFRAHGSRPHPLFQEGDVLAFSGGNVHLRADEWLTAAKALEVFLAFRDGQPPPADLGWRDISVALTGKR